MTVCFMFNWVYCIRVNSFKNGDADQERSELEQAVNNKAR